MATILKGARGVGKSTLIRQFLFNKQKNGDKVLNISADSTLIDTKLAQLAYEFNKMGGVYLALDEIHKYNGWQAEVKTIVDSFPNIKLIISGSSSLNLDNAAADLSRRHIMLHAKGLSFREFLKKTYDLNFNSFTLEQILANISELLIDINGECIKYNIDLLQEFKVYLQQGYFLSRQECRTDKIYFDSLNNSINSTIETDLPSVYTDIDNISKQNIKKLLKHIALKCPFTPNISELAVNLGIANDNTLKKYLYYLHTGEILTNLYASNKSHKDFQKPHKIFLNNTNYSYAFCETPDIGTVRETFVANCLNAIGDLTAPTYGDFCLNDKWTFEVGGKNKKNRQIKLVENSYVLADDILSVEKGRIPLWLLGFLW